MKTIHLRNISPITTTKYIIESNFNIPDNNNRILLPKLVTTKATYQGLTGAKKREIVAKRTDSKSPFKPTSYRPPYSSFPSCKSSYPFCDFYQKSTGAKKRETVAKLYPYSYPASYPASYPYSYPASYPYSYPSTYPTYSTTIKPAIKPAIKPLTMNPTIGPIINSNSLKKLWV